MVVRALIEAGSTSVALLDLHQESVDQAKDELMAWYGTSWSHLERGLMLS